MIFSQQQLKQQPQHVDCSYESSSSSSLTKGLNLPAVPSPLHNTESATRSSSSRLPPTVSRNTSDPFFNRLSADIVAYSPLKNRQAPPPPPPPKMPIHQHRISSSGGSGGALDDDDSLVFKMSELSGYEENTPNSGHSSSFYYGSNRDEYLQRLKMAAALNDDGNDGTRNKMRRAVSTGGTPISVVNTVAATSAAVAIINNDDSRSKSDPIAPSSNKFKTIQQDQDTKITRRLFYGES